MKSYSELLVQRYSPIPTRRLIHGECQTAQQKRCTICFAGKLGYDTEVNQKQQTIDEFWSSLNTGIEIQPLVASPLGRAYRTVSKRKAFLVNKKFFLGLIGVDEDTAKNYPLSVEQCAIEPEIHSKVYKAIHQYLQQKEHFSLAEEFNYVIVKGNEKEAIVIFNLNHFSSTNRKEINKLSKHLTAKINNILGIFVFVDKERSPYYLSSSQQTKTTSKAPTILKIFGKDKLFHSIDGTKFLYSPLSFTQTNHSILESFTGAARQLLSLSQDDTLIDLYCGYGLFSVIFAKEVKQIIGIELSRSSINDAIGNARINKIDNVKFISSNITIENLQRYLKKGTPHLKLLIDPPRNGTGEHVIEFLASLQPEKIVHIFCNTNIIAKELQRWKQCGYSLVQACAVDMFPGTSDIEIMIELKK